MTYVNMPVQSEIASEFILNMPVKLVAGSTWKAGEIHAPARQIQAAQYDNAH